MFGIGQKKEAVKPAKKVEPQVEDEIQFDFEEDDNLPFDDGEEFVDDDFIDEQKSNRLRQGIPKRTVVLIGLLLLIGIGGGGYLYLNSTEEPPPPPPAKKKIAVAKPAAPAKDVASTANADKQPVAVPTTAAGAKAVSTPPAAVAAKSEVKAAGVKTDTAVSAEKKPAPDAAVKSTVKAQEKEPAPVAAASVAATEGPKPFILSAGAFASQKNQRATEKLIRRLGYTPKVSTIHGMVPMTRLLLGVYDSETAQSKSQELKGIIPDIFTLRKGDKVALYAGSYQSIDQARKYADELFVQGIRVEEEPVSLRMPLKRITYGAFSSRNEAEKAAKKAVASGLIAEVLKR